MKPPTQRQKRMFAYTTAHPVHSFSSVWIWCVLVCQDISGDEMGPARVSEVPIPIEPALMLANIETLLNLFCCLIKLRSHLQPRLQYLSYFSGLVIKCCNNFIKNQRLTSVTRLVFTTVAKKVLICFLHCINISIHMSIPCLCSALDVLVNVTVNIFVKNSSISLT